MRKNKLMSVVAALAVGGVALSGCKSEASGSGVVDDETIKLGALIDLSGPFAATGKDFVIGMEIAVEEINADGGICDRQVELVTRDHAYDVQKAVLAYDEVEPDVAMFPSIFGSAITAALRDKIEADQILAAPTSYSSALLGVENLVIIGATYDITAISSLDWMMQEGMLKKGDTIGELYLEGELGESSHEGVQWAVEELGMKLESFVVKPTDADFASQVGSMRAKGVKAIQMATTGAQVASVAATAQSVGLDVPIMGNGPTWNNAMFDTAAAPALEKNFYRPFVSYGLDDEGSPKSVELTEAYQKANPGQRPLSGSGVVAGYASIVASRAALETTCGDLSREAILKARSKVEPLDVDGTYPSLDISDLTVPSTTEIIIEKADKNSLDGVKVVEPLFASGLAAKYLSSK